MHRGRLTSCGGERRRKTELLLFFSWSRGGWWWLQSEDLRALEGAKKKNRGSSTTGRPGVAGTAWTMVRVRILNFDRPWCFFDHIFWFTNLKFCNLSSGHRDGEVIYHLGHFSLDLCSWHYSGWPALTSPAKKNHWVILQTPFYIDCMLFSLPSFNLYYAQRGYMSKSFLKILRPQFSEG